jgi:hypothetical protein
MYRHPAKQYVNRTKSGYKDGHVIRPRIWPVLHDQVAVSVFGPLDLYVLAYIGFIMKGIYLRHKAKIAKVISDSRLSSASLSLLPYELMVIGKALPKLVGIGWIGIYGNSSIEAFLMCSYLLASI